MILPELDVSKWDTSSCTDMSFMFYGCQGPKTIDVSNWDVSNVANFDHMTAHSYLVFEGVDNWAPSSKCTNMNAMFHSLQNTSIDVSKYDTSNVTVFDQMFQNAYELTEVIGLENFNTSNGVGFSEMFQHCYNIQELNLSSFDTTHAKDGEPASTNGSFTTTMSLMFQDMYKLQKISIGKKFSFKGDGTGWDGNYAVLPTPNTEYIEGADGNWYDIDKTPYAAANVPDETVATYYASPDLAEKEDNELVLVKQGSLIRTANAIRAKNNLYEQYKPSEFANGIYDIDIDTHLATLFNGEAEEIVSDKITKIFSLFQANNKNLKKVDLPLITKLPESCFAHCSNLMSVNCPAVTEIEAGAMEGCNVTELIFPECVTIKGWGWTFAANHNLIKAVFPKLTNITSASFALCGSLKALVLGSSSVVTLGEGNVFNESGIATGTGYVYVPRNLVESYKVAEHWSTYASQIRA
jgi:surface protein